MSAMIKSLAPYILFIIPQTIQSSLQLLTSTTGLITCGLNSLKSYYYYDIPELDGFIANNLFSSVTLYLGDIASTSTTTNRVTLCRAEYSPNFTYGLSPDNQITDTFNGITVYWEYSVSSHNQNWSPLPMEMGMRDLGYQMDDLGNKESRKFTLRLRRKEKDLVLPAYLDHIMDCAEKLRSRSRELRLYNHDNGGMWAPIKFKHPSTFDNLAMDPLKKEKITADLHDFADQCGNFYQRTGRAWKRGYLLYGPCGTGKSSMIAAMANYLRYDIYHVELTRVHSNSELRNLLMMTTSKSIIVIEDTDCLLNLTKRGNEKSAPVDSGKSSITLSGLWNFCDGLRSCCGSERIIVFTTNHINNVDPALLRSGRMDMHIHTGYCSLVCLKMLTKNYSEFKECDEKMVELEGVIEEAMITPADMIELLIKKRRRMLPEALAELVEELKARKKQRREKEGGGQVRKHVNEEEEGLCKTETDTH